MSYLSFLLLGSGFLILVVVHGVIIPRAKELSKAVKKKNCACL